MKLSSLMASVLLGGSILLFSGCSTDPDAAAEKIKDDLFSEISTYSIILVNDTSAEVEFTGVSRDTEKQKVISKSSNSFAYSGTIDISYPGESAHTFNKSSGIYVATNCNGKKSLHDIETSDNLQVVNLTGAEFAAGSIKVKETNTSTPISGDLYYDCAINSTSNFSNVTFTLDTLISTDTGASYKTIRKIDPTFVNLGEEMKYFLIAYDDGNISFLPLVKVDLNDLAKTQP